MHCGDQRHAELCPAQAVGESHSHGTTLSASDIHNGLWKNFKNNKTKETLIKVNIPCINLALNWYNVHDSTTVYVNNDAIITANFITSQMNAIATQLILLRACVNGNELICEIYDSAPELNYISSFTRDQP